MAVRCHRFRGGPALVVAAVALLGSACSSSPPSSGSATAPPAASLATALSSGTLAPSPSAAASSASAGPASPSGDSSSGPTRRFPNLGISVTLPSSWVAIDPTNPGPPDLMARWTAARPNIGQQLGQLASIWPIRSGAYGDTAFVAVDTNTFVMTSLAAVAPPGDVAGPAVAKAALQARFAYLAINEDAPASVFEEFQAPAGSAVQAYIPEGGPGGGAVYDMVVLPGGLELLLQAAISSSDWTPTEASTYRSVVSAIRVVGTPTGRPAFIDKALMARLPSRIGTDQVFVVGGSIVAIAEANPDQARLLSLVYAQLAATGLQPATFSGAYLDGPANAIVETVKVDGLSASRRDRAIAALKTSGFTVSTAVPGAIERPVPGTTPAATEYLLARGDLFVDVITPEPARAAAILAALP